MKYRYYPNVIRFISVRVRKKFAKIKAKEGLKNIPAHILWMMERMQDFDDSAKAGRWIGWVLAHAEMLGILTNTQSRKLVKKDLQKGFI